MGSADGVCRTVDQEAMTVMLSGETAARSAAVSESKDPAEACATTDVERYSHDALECTGRIP